MLVATCLAAVTVAAVALMPVQAAVRPPKLQYQMMTLPNGLRVSLSEDHSTPIVHVSVTYHVGSKNERAGRTGFAHLFEHMMFKGTPTIGAKDHGKEKQLIAELDKVRLPEVQGKTAYEVRKIRGWPLARSWGSWIRPGFHALSGDRSL